MTSTTTETPESDAAATPTERAEELEADLVAAGETVAQAREDARHHLHKGVQAVKRLRRAQARHRLRAVEADALEQAAAEEVEVDVPEIDRLEIGPASRRDLLHDYYYEVEDALLQNESSDERTARSARTVLRNLREARRSGDPDAARTAVRQLRDRLGQPGWMDDDVARRAWVAPAEKRLRELRERAVCDRVLRWCASAWRGREPGDPREAFPPELAEIVADFLTTGALEARNGPWAVPRSWYPAAAEVNPGDLRGERDLKTEIEDAVRRLDDAVLEELVP